MRQTSPLSVPVIALFLALVAAGHPAGAQWPPEIKNLQVLPEDSTPEEVMAVMRGFATALGVRCQHCHVGEEGQRLSEFDFESDEKAAKKKARIMFEMTKAINADFLPRFGDDRAGVEVRCVTCHRGTEHPEMIERVVLAALDEEGVEAAEAKYRELREEFYGGHTYDFSEKPLNQLAEEVGLGGRLQEAEGLIRLNLEFNPESSWAYSLLGEVKSRQGDSQAARKSFEKSLELDPRNSFARRRLEEMSAEEESEAPTDGQP